MTATRNVLLTAFVLSLNPALSFAEITADSWEVDARYEYSKISSQEGVKSTSLNFYLDESINPATSIHGVFTLKDDNDKSIYATNDFVRQLYTSHTANNGIKVKIGKQTSKYDRKLAFQKLRIDGGSCSEEAFKGVCDGVLSIYLDKDIGKNTNLELLVGEGESGRIDWDGTQYKLHLEHDKGDNQYHLYLDRTNSKNNFTDEEDEYEIVTVGNNRTIGTGVSVGVEFLDAGRDKYFASYSISKHDNKHGGITYYSNDAKSFHSGASQSKNKNLSLGRVVFFDDLFVKIDAGYSERLHSYKANSLYRSKDYESIYTDGSNGSQYQKRVSLNTAYPLERGEVSSYHGYSSDNLGDSNAYNRIGITHKIDKNILSLLSYSNSRRKQLSRNRTSTNDYFSIKIKHQF